MENDVAHGTPIRGKHYLMLACRAACKINLTLEVLSRRPDGYHLLKSVVHCVGLWDTLYFEFGIGSDFSLRSNWPTLMTEDNLCLRAARRWAEIAATKRKQHFGGVRITLKKTIPMGGGLGGGSSDAAVTLLLLNSHHGNLLDMCELHQIAVGLGADVPFFLKGGCALMEGIGEELTPLPTIKAWIVLICPKIQVRTPDVFRAFDALPPRATQEPTSDILKRHLHPPNLRAIGSALHNDLTEAATTRFFNPSENIEVLLRYGALGASMSGSGSTVFGIFENKQQAQNVRSKIAEELDEDCLVYAVPLVAESYVLLPDPDAGFYL